MFYANFIDGEGRKQANLYYGYSKWFEDPYHGIQCIPLYKIDNTMIQESHCTLSPEYYYSNTKPLKDVGMIEEYKTHLEKWYNEEIQPMNKLIRRI